MEENGNEVVTERDLDEFRNQWRQELKNPTTEISREDQAKQLFIQGVELEKKGKCFEAIRCYRRAIQLDPDIEFKAYRELSQQKLTSKVDKKNNNKTQNLITGSSSRDIDNDDEVEDLIDCFQRDLTLNNRYCEPSYGCDVVTTSLHISCLPFEAFIAILKWIVTNDLDFKSLENFGEVCKGFYLLARDQEIWRLACMKVWGPNCSPTISWRDMFINRTRVKFNGCYISKISYQRLGENSFQDQFYRPVQLVEYYRLIRFLPDGNLYMMTSADDLQTSVNKMKNKTFAIQSKDILKGRYSYQDSVLLIIIKKQSSRSNTKFKRKEQVTNDGEYTFFLELEIQSTSQKRKFNKLIWKNYSINQLGSENDVVSEFDLRSASKYPPFFFSPVKSFFINSNECLNN